MSELVNKVQIEKRLIERISVREWGVPTLVMPGQIWRSAALGTISCMVASTEANKVRIETLPLEVIRTGDLSIMPDHWRDALLEYVTAYPHSGSGLAPFLRITEAQRCAMIRKLAERLGDDIACRHIAKCMGELASIEFETVEPKPKAWRSIAVWPDTIRVGNIVGKNESDDTHDSREAAQAVCGLLRKHGFGGNGKVFPISTRVEPVWE